MAKQHSFSEKAALEVGINSAIMLEFFNKEMKNSAHEQRVTGYVKLPANYISECLKIFNERQIRYTINHLEGNGYIHSITDNDHAYDRSKSYSITQKGKALLA